MGWSINRLTGLTFHRPEVSTKGYTLVTPHAGNSCYLIDMDGCIVHEWKFHSIRPGSGRLLKNGNLLMSGSDIDLPRPPKDEPTKAPLPFEQHVTRLGAITQHCRKLTGEGLSSGSMSTRPSITISTDLKTAIRWCRSGWNCQRNYTKRCVVAFACRGNDCPDCWGTIWLKWTRTAKKSGEFALGNCWIRAKTRFIHLREDGNGLISMALTVTLTGTLFFQAEITTGSR